MIVPFIPSSSGMLWRYDVAQHLTMQKQFPAAVWLHQLRHLHSPEPRQQGVLQRSAVATAVVLRMDDPRDRRRWRLASIAGETECAAPWLSHGRPTWYRPKRRRVYQPRPSPRRPGRALLLARSWLPQSKLCVPLMLPLRLTCAAHGQRRPRQRAQAVRLRSVLAPSRWHRPLTVAGGNPLAHAQTHDPALRMRAFGGEFQPGLHR